MAKDLLNKWLSGQELNHFPGVLGFGHIKLFTSIDQSATVPLPRISINQRPHSYMSKRFHNCFTAAAKINLWTKNVVAPLNFWKLHLRIHGRIRLGLRLFLKRHAPISQWNA